MAGRSAGTIATFIIGTLMILIGGGIGFFIGKPILDHAKASESWPTTEGRVIESELERSRGKKGKSQYSALVVYEFEVDDEKFEGDEIWFGQYSSSDRSAMEKLVHDYPVGKDVTVHYSPDEPSAAVLQPGAFTSSYMVYGIGMLFFGIGCLLVAIPLIKIFFITAAVVTSSPDDFAGGGGSSSDGGFASAGSSDDYRIRHVTDDDGFDGIPGS